jgi:hypothetical protein
MAASSHGYSQEFADQVVKLIKIKTRQDVLIARPVCQENYDWTVIAAGSRLVERVMSVKGHLMDAHFMISLLINRMTAQTISRSALSGSNQHRYFLYHVAYRWEVF